MRRAITRVLMVGMLAPALVAGSAHGSTAPEGIHVAFGSDPRSTATIAWHTGAPAATQVAYGPSAALGSLATGGSSPAPHDSVYLHEVVLTDLAPGSVVHYRAGSDAGGWSPIFSFRTAPAGDAAFRFTVFGDHGRKPQSVRTSTLVKAADPDLHLIAGDLSYANEVAPRWNEWFVQNEPLLATTPMMAAPGNHETDDGETQDAATVYRARFAFPGAELYYSFDYGRVHFLMLHSTVVAVTDDRAFADQWSFAEEDLARAAERKRADDLDFIVVVQHHPLYANMRDTSLAGGYVERQYNPPLIALLERMLHLYDVDVLITGHNHHYERSKPMVYGQPTTAARSEYTDPVGFVEVITGGGGESLYQFKDPNDFSSWSAASARRYHFTQFDVADGVLTASAISTDDQPGQVIDTWTLRTG